MPKEIELTGDAKIRVGPVEIAISTKPKVEYSTLRDLKARQDELLEELKKLGEEIERREKR